MRTGLTCKVMGTKPLLAHSCLHPAQVEPYQMVNLSKYGSKVCERLRYLFTAEAEPVCTKVSAGH